MSGLDDFTPEQRDLLVSLPYRAGLWVSESDDDGGGESQEAELKTLESLIVGYAEDFLKSEFVEMLMKHTLAHKEKWPEWSENLEAVPEECRQAVEILQESMDSKHVLAFRQNLMEIARAVALAYREFDEETDPLGERLSMYSRYYWDVFMARLKKQAPPALDDVLNISKAERAVLKQLSEALQVDIEGNPLNAAEAA